MWFIDDDKKKYEIDFYNDKHLEENFIKGFQLFSTKKLAKSDAVFVEEINCRIDKRIEVDKDQDKTVTGYLFFFVAKESDDSDVYELYYGGTDRIFIRNVMNSSIKSDVLEIYNCNFCVRSDVSKFGYKK